MSIETLTAQILQNNGSISPKRAAKLAAILVYADGTDWDPGSGAGVYVYTGSVWSKL